MVSGYKNALCSTAEFYEFVFMAVLKQSLIEPYCQDYFLDNKYFIFQSKTIQYMYLVVVVEAVVLQSESLFI